MLSGHHLQNHWNASVDNRFTSSTIQARPHLKQEIASVRIRLRRQMEEYRFFGSPSMHVHGNCKALSTAHYT